MYDNSPFCGIYDPLENVDAYLHRIDFFGKPEVSLSCLKELMKCHLRTVPFENLDVYHGRRIPSLNTNDLFDKIVVNRRGGYCFELNGLFWRLLESLGFKTWCCAAKIVLHRNYPMPLVHRVVLVELKGKKYFCDVGFGGPVPYEPIEIHTEITQDSSEDVRYRFSRDNDWTTLLIQKGREYTPLMVFREEPNDPVDFIPLNTFCAVSLEEPFLKKNMVQIASEHGRYSIDGNVFRMTEMNNVWETVLTNEEHLRSVLEEYFGIVYNGELRFNKK